MSRFAISSFSLFLAILTVIFPSCSESVSDEELLCQEAQDELALRKGFFESNPDQVTCLDYTDALKDAILKCEDQAEEYQVILDELRCDTLDKCQGAANVALQKGFLYGSNPNLLNCLAYEQALKEAIRVCENPENFQTILDNLDCL